jgi:2-polyprenyl-3-methyl-5-hydroxy-6-metoxy-1,4-benzoquinol methylase
MDTLSAYPQLSDLTARLLDRWPAHASYVAKSFEGRGADVLTVSEELAQVILTLGSSMEHGVSGLVDDYRYLCETLMLPEELYFRRHGRYRLSRFEDAERECYADPVLMGRYMNGVLLSGVFWDNHARAFASYHDNYLPRLPAGASHLEIGPGHGFLLLLAARQKNIARLTGWDVSPTSVAHTTTMLETLGVARPVSLTCMNLFEAASASADEGFDSIVMSEILEHLEDPVAALRAASRQLKPGGLLWVNVPANSPAPDHIYLIGGLEEAIELVRAADLEVVDSVAIPMTGATLEKAISRKLTVSCLIVARKPESGGGAA